MLKLNGKTRKKHNDFNIKLKLQNMYATRYSHNTLIKLVWSESIFSDESHKSTILGILHNWRASTQSIFFNSEKCYI